MKAVALVSGGKDSTLNMMRCVEHGHQIVALANLFPAGGDGDELDSFMYQTVGHDGIEAIAHCMGLPLYRRAVRKGTSVSTSLEYTRTDGDEVEELYTLLQRVKRDMPEVDAVASGAILSNYQRTRVESVCMRLGLTSLAFLWKEDQSELLDEMIDGGVEAILIKVACMGLSRAHLGKSLAAVRPTLHKLNKEYGAHICGEGGEFETFTLDCCLYRKRIILDECRVVVHQDDDYAPVAYLRLTKTHLEDKTESSAMLQGQEGASRIIMVTDSDDTIGARAERDRDNIDKDEKHRDWVHLPLRVRCAADVRPDCWGMTVGEEADAVLASLARELGEQGSGWHHVFLMGVYLYDMKDFGAVNAVYSKHLPLRCPSARMCVAVPLSAAPGRRVAIECMASGVKHDTLHVQSISRWAPSNIGPYSQAKTLSDSLVVVSGQIALDPGSMTIRAQGARAECEQCLSNLDKILEACGSSLQRSVRMTAFVTDLGCQQDVMDAWAARVVADEPCCIDFVCVSGLPRGALVELLVAATLVPKSSDGAGPGAGERLQVPVLVPPGCHVQCVGQRAQLCAATCVAPAGMQGAECGRLLAQMAVACLEACELEMRDVMNLRIMYTARDSSNVTFAQDVVTSVEADITQASASSSLDKDVRAAVAAAVLPVKGVSVPGWLPVPELSTGVSDNVVCAQVLALRCHASGDDRKNERI